MNEGYRLTDFTLEELSLLCESLQSLKHAKRRELTEIQNFDIDDKCLGERINISIKIERLLEMNVRALTAFGIVKEREKSLSN